MKFKPEVENYRITNGALGTQRGDQFGIFDVPFKTVALTVVVSNGVHVGKRLVNWEHVSVSLKNRCPNWPEMCFIKDLFWEAEETVMPFHPPKSLYINNHEHCLHLWRHISAKVILPPVHLIGMQDEN